jgi:uncharacterized repeat protein (TIGR01451 family)
MFQHLSRLLQDLEEWLAYRALDPFPARSAERRPPPHPNRRKFMKIVASAPIVGVAALLFALLLPPGPSAHAQSLPRVVELADLNTSGNLDGTVLTGSSAFEKFGEGLRGIGDINADGFPDVAIGAPASDANGTDSGTVYVLYGAPGTFPPLLAPSDFDGSLGFVIQGRAPNFFTGREVAAAGDFNGDGIDDLALSAPLAFTGTFFVGGEVYVLFGRDDAPFPATVELSALNGKGPTATPGITIRGAAALDQAGFSVDGGGDFNADGVDDLLIGIANADIEPGGSNRGQVVVLFGRDDGSLPDVVELMDLNGTGPNAAAGTAIDGFNDNERIGGVVRNVGDVDGDGVDDILIANSTNSTTDYFNYLVYGSASLPPSVSLADLNGVGPTATAGATLICEHPCFDSVGAVGDFNADGTADFAVGQTFARIPNETIGSGNAVIVFGGAALPEVIDLGAINDTGPMATPGVRIDGAASFDRAGNAIAPAGDFNRDGFDDVMIAAYRSDSLLTDSGSTYVLFGGPPNAGQTEINLAQYAQPGTATSGLRINGAAVWDRSGERVAPAGDLNADGSVDLLISTIDADRNDLEDAGEAYVVFGVAVPDVVVTKSNGVNYLRPGEVVVYTITVENRTGAVVDDVMINDVLPESLDGDSATWTCTPAGAANCDQPNGSGDIQATVDLGAFGQVTFELVVQVSGSEAGQVANTATATLPTGVDDANPADNQSTDRDPIGLFIDGFEPERP